MKIPLKIRQPVPTISKRFHPHFHSFTVDIKETAQAVNKTMLELVSSKSDMSQIFKHLDLDSIMEVLRQYLAHSSVETKVAVLKWIHHLFTEAKDKVTTDLIHLPTEWNFNK